MNVGTLTLRVKLHMFMTWGAFSPALELEGIGAAVGRKDWAKISTQKCVTACDSHPGPAWKAVETETDTWEPGPNWPLTVSGSPGLSDFQAGGQSVARHSISTTLQRKLDITI